MDRWFLVPRCEDCVFLYIRAAATWRPYADIVLQFQHTGGSGCSGQFQFVLVLPRSGRVVAGPPSNSCGLLITDKRIFEAAVGGWS